MKLSIRIAGICASGTFILTALPGFYQHTKPTSIMHMANETLAGMTILETLMISMGGAFAAAFIGYVMGDILSNPKGGPKKKKKSSVAAGPPVRQLSTALDDAMAAAPPADEAVPPSEPATAEEG
jgi:hypothetical protein